MPHSLRDVFPPQKAPPPMIVRPKRKFPWKIVAWSIGVVVIVAAIGASGWFTQQKISQLESQLYQAQSQLAMVTQQNSDLEARVAQLTCAGLWSSLSNTCKEIALSATPASGAAVPLSVTFSASIPQSAYTIDFGDGATAAFGSSDCKPNAATDLCDVSVSHTFESTAHNVFVVLLQHDGVVAASTTVAIGVSR